jgi:membrane protein DedA with SNARE-associated domain
MTRFFSLVGAVLGGWGAWKLGLHLGLLGAYFASVFGTAAGFFLGRRLAENLLE